MPQIVDEHGELSASCLMIEALAGETNKMSTRSRQVAIGRAQELHRTCYFCAPEPHDDRKIELHVIMDCARSIRTNADLIAAIGMHFSSAREENVEVQLNDSAFSQKFIITDWSEGTQTPILAELMPAVERFVTATEYGQNTLIGESRVTDVPEYLR
jgi:hypothetical protein